MGSAKERFRQWLAKGRLYPLYGLSLEEAACAIWQDAEIEHARIAKQREAELVELLRRARWALHVWESQDYDVQSRLSLQNEAADLRCEIASRLESYKAEGRENDNDER